MNTLLCADTKEEKTIKEQLASFGYEVQRLEEDGHFKGVRILKDGVQIHSSPRASWEFAVRLIEDECSARNEANYLKTC